MSKAAYQISVAGVDVTAAFGPVLVRLEIVDGDGGKADSCTITLDDSFGRIFLPPPGSEVEVLLWWEEPPPGVPAGAVSFSGVTDEPRSGAGHTHSHVHLRRPRSG